ncbi:MAG: uroporphyrinogen decarboxylase family protein [Thermoproteota archaeon]
MKPIDRVLTTLNHEEPDMVPCLWAVADGLRRLQEAFRSREMPQDLVGVGSIPETRVLEQDSEHMLLESFFGDIHRVSYKVDYGYRELVKPAILKPEDLDRLEEQRFELSREHVKRIGENVEKNSDRFTFISHESPFGFAAYSLRGFKKFLTDMVMNPCFAKRILSFGVKRLTEIARQIIEETGVNGVWLSGDLGDRNGPFLSPKLCREILEPFDRELCRIYHNQGAYVFLHSHGNLNLILDRLVDAGFDGLNPLDEAENMVLASVKEKYGSKVTLIPQPSTYKLEKIPRNLIEEYVASQLHAGAHGGGFIYYGVIVNMPLENAEEYVKTFLKLRSYPLQCCRR